VETEPRPTAPFVDKQHCRTALLLVVLGVSERRLLGDESFDARAEISARQLLLPGRQCGWGCRCGFSRTVALLNRGQGLFEDLIHAAASIVLGPAWQDASRPRAGR
jgi:hypothetical protein